jgi:hypothetical protein
LTIEPRSRTVRVASAAEPCVIREETSKRQDLTLILPLILP